MKYTVIFIVAVLVLLNATSAAATYGAKADLGYDGKNILVNIQNMDETEIMKGNYTLTLVDNRVETISFELAPQEKKEWNFTPKNAAHAVLSVRYYLGTEGPLNIQLDRRIEKVKAEPQKTPGFEMLLSLIPLAMLAIWRNKK